MGCGGLEGGFKVDAANALVSVAQQFVGAILNRVRDIRVGRTAICQVVFEAAVSRRIVRRGDDNAIGKALRATLVVRKDGAGNTGVGVKPSSLWMKVSTPFAASTSSARVQRDGRGRGCLCP